MSHRAYVLLGRTGDVINALPIFRAEPERPWVVVGRQYVDLLSGVSYVEPVPYDGEETDLRGAMKAASVLSDDVKSIQVIGDTDSVKTFTYSPAGFTEAQTDSFQKEPYKLLGKFALWAEQARPVFDQRDPKREAALIAQLPKKPEKCILVAAKGRSSPFPYGDLLFELLQSRFGRQFAIVDLSTLRAECFYDFLGMLERAHCLVTVDSAFLHLAHACENLPVVALINDKPSLWHGSAWRANHIAHIRYGDFPTRAVEALEAIKGIGKAGSWFNIETRNAAHRIIHVWSTYELTEDNLKGHFDAETSWEELLYPGPWVSTPVEVGTFGRDSKHSKSVKDKTPIPFLKDVIRTGCARARDNDLIVFTRCDTEVIGSLHKILDGPAFAHRYIIDENGIASWHPACDLFAFTKKWWNENQASIPDFWLGYDQFWNRVLRETIVRSGGVDLGFVIQRPASTKTIQEGIRKQQNEYFYSQWQEKHGDIALAPAVADQLPTVVVNRHALSPFGYNPSIIRYGDRLLMAYRYHDQKDSSTALAIAEIDETGKVTRNRPLLIPHVGGSEEDARFFMRGDKLWLSYVDSTYPAMPPRCVVKYGQVVEDNGWKLQHIQQPVFNRNDMSGTEKNWLFWQHNDILYAFYSLSNYAEVKESPNRSFLLKVDGTKVEIAACHDKSLTWAFGKIRGGTTPIPYKGYLLTFFHSALDNELPPYRRRYFVGALLMQAEPPFAPVVISKTPVLWGSERDSLESVERSSCAHWKSKCVLPFGAVDLGGGKLLLSCGINDSHCGLVTVNESALHL